MHRPGRVLTREAGWRPNSPNPARAFRWWCIPKLTAYENGYAVYEVDGSHTVMAVDRCNDYRYDFMNAESMNMANVTAKIEGSKAARPPGGFPLASAPKKIFICSPYQPTANDSPCRKAQLEANIQRAKTACRILATMGVLPLAPHLYFTQFLKDEDAQERATGIRFGMEWLEAADEVWVFGETMDCSACRVIFTSYCFACFSCVSILNLPNQSCKNFISRCRLIRLCLCIAYGHSCVELVIRHLTSGLRISRRHTRPERKTIPKDDLPIEHIDRSRSRNTQIGQNRFCLLFQFRLHPCCYI